MESLWPPEHLAPNPWAMSELRLQEPGEVASVGVGSHDLWSFDAADRKLFKILLYL